MIYVNIKTFFAKTLFPVLTKKGVLMQENWVHIKEFPVYTISNFGRIVNEEKKWPIRASLNSSGILRVGLVKEGKQYTRSVKVLVADHYLLHGWTNIFNTAIQLDGDPWNCRVDNLDWRPRWFAMQHAEQFRGDISRVHYQGPLIDPETDAMYEHVVHAAICHGLLFKDIWSSIYDGKPTFPTNQTFKIMRN